MKQLSIDIETYSSTNLNQTGVYRYADSDDFELLLFGYAVDFGQVKVVDLTQGEKIPPQIIQALIDPTIIKSAFNAQFERVCLSHFVGRRLKPAGWHCSRVWAANLGLPLSLRDVGTVLGLPRQKSTAGKELVRYFCTPCKPTKANQHWWSSTVINILRNINYTGDMLCQKTYRDDQYRRHFNQGELAQYLIEEHHPALVSHRNFNKAQELLKQTAQQRNIEPGSHKYQQRYLFSGKIICNHCNSTFKRQTRPNKICCACQKHLHSAKLCPVKSVPEKGIQNAFCTMMNKLIFSRKFLLSPLVQELKEHFNDPDGELGRLTNQIKANDQKAETLMNLVKEGLIDKGPIH